MSIQYHPFHLPEALEETYRTLLKHSHEGHVYVSIRQLLADLGLQSPLPLFCRLQKLANMGVIAYTPA